MQFSHDNSIRQNWYVINTSNALSFALNTSSVLRILCGPHAPPPENQITQHPSEFVLYVKRNICAYFGAFTFDLHDFRPNKPDYNKNCSIAFDRQIFPVWTGLFQVNCNHPACWKMFHLANRYKIISVISVKHLDSRVNKTNCLPPDHCSKKV